MNKKRIVITGIGIVSPIGIGIKQFWDNLFAGKSGIKPITLFDTSNLKVKVAGEITDFDANDILGKKGLIDLDRATRLLLAATKFCLEDANVQINESNSISTGVCIGTTFGSLNSLSEFDRSSLIDGPNLVNPSRFPNTVINSPASRVGIRHVIKGFNATISTGACACLDALDFAVQALSNGRVERVIVGAVEEMCLQTMIGLQEMNYLAGLNGVSPCSRPFDKRREGIIFSEASIAFLVESLDSAIKRQARIYGEVNSLSAVFDPHSLYKFNSKGQGMYRAMKESLIKAKINLQDVDCIFANANSTYNADLLETKMIKKVFKAFTRTIPVTAMKSMVGETMSSSGGIALAAALGSISEGMIPPTINYEVKDPFCDLDYVINISRKKSIDKAMVNTFSPHGAHNSLIVGAV